jgi:hypothetical protein
MLKDPDDLSPDELSKVLKVEMIECFGGPFDGSSMPVTNLSTDNIMRVLHPGTEDVAEYALRVRVDTDTNEVKRVLEHLGTENHPGIDIVDFMTGERADEESEDGHD